MYQKGVLRGSYNVTIKVTALITAIEKGISRLQYFTVTIDKV